MAQDPNAPREEKVPEFPTIALIGETGAGKSTFGNVLLGFNQFETSDDAERCTLKTSSAIGTLLSQTDLSFSKEIDDSTESSETTKYLKNREAKKHHKIQVVDTVGLENDKDDDAHIADIIKAMIDLQNTSVVAIVVNGTNPRIKPLCNIIDKYSEYIDQEVLLRHVIIVFTYFEIHKSGENWRAKYSKEKEKKSNNFLKGLRAKYPEVQSLKQVDKLNWMLILNMNI